MSSADFQKMLKYATIASNDYPISGTSIISPYGTAIKKKLFDYVTKTFEKMGYRETELPTVVSPEFIEHLRKEELFKLSNPYTTVFASPGFGHQAIIAQDQNVESYRNLPFKVYSKGLCHRQTTKTPFIKELQMNITEFNAFFESEQAMTNELAEFDIILPTILESLGIPSIAVKDSLDSTAQHKHYAFFPFSEKFGSIFCSSPLFDKFTSAISKGFTDKDGQTETAFQLCSSFTSRLFYAYLANHMDEKGFAIPPEFQPYSVLLETREMSENQRNNVEVILMKNDIPYDCLNCNSREVSFNRFMATGIPLHLGAGVKDYKLRLRSSNVEWIPHRELENAIITNLKKYKINNKIENIKHIHINSSQPEYESKAAYTIDVDNQKELKRNSLKHIGFNDDGSKAVFVHKRY